MSFCKYCGSKNEEDAQYCEKCGKNLIDQDKPKIQPLGEPKKPLRPQNGVDTSIDKKPSTVILVLGYLLAFLGGIFGIAMGTYLFTRKNSDAKFHGRNMIIIAVILILIGLASSAFLLSNFDTSPSLSDPLEVTILDEYRDGTGFFIIEGEVQNFGNNDLTSVNIKTTGYDRSENIVAVNEVYSTPSDMPAGGRAQFTVKLDDTDNAIVRYTLIATGNT